MDNDLNFSDNWNLLEIYGERRIYRDDIESIVLSESRNSFILRVKRERGLFFYPKHKCHFHIQ